MLEKSTRLKRHRATEEDHNGINFGRVIKNGRKGLSVSKVKERQKQEVSMVGTEYNLDAIVYGDSREFFLGKLSMKLHTTN